MARSFISKRVVFPCGKQKEFLLNAKKMLNLSYTDLARQLKISNRTLTDWKREKFLMSLRAVKIISKRTNRKIPKNIEIKEPFWYVYKSAKLVLLPVSKNMEESEVIQSIVKRNGMNGGRKKEDLKNILLLTSLNQLKNLVFQKSLQNLLE